MIELVVTSPLSLARLLWWYGEEAWWPVALELRADEVASLAPRFAELLGGHELMEGLWPGAPVLDAHLVVGTIEYLEGAPRAPSRRHRRSAPMPEVLDLSEEDRWSDPVLAEVLRLLDEQTGHLRPRDPASLAPRLHGRWASA